MVAFAAGPNRRPRVVPTAPSPHAAHRDTSRLEHGMTDGDYETARITITRVLTAGGTDETFVDASAGMSLVEALGLLRLAEDTLIQHPPAEDDDDEAA